MPAPSPPRILKDNYIKINHNILPKQPEPPVHPPTPPHPHQPPPPRDILKDPRRFLIHTILGHKNRHYNDSNGILKNDTSYLCQWTTRNNNIYNKRKIQRDLFPWYNVNTCAHNIGLLTQYYTKSQHKHFLNLIKAHFVMEQQRDTRYVTPATIIPLAHISINECNPENDIKTNTNTIQTHFDVAHIYENNGRPLTTIPKTKLHWLRKQYHLAKLTCH